MPQFSLSPKRPLTKPCSPSLFPLLVSSPCDHHKVSFSIIHYCWIQALTQHSSIFQSSASALNLLSFPPINSFADALLVLQFFLPLFPLQVLYWHWLNCNNCSSKSRLTTATMSLFSPFFHSPISCSTYHSGLLAHEQGILSTALNANRITWLWKLFLPFT